LIGTTDSLDLAGTSPYAAPRRRTPLQAVEGMDMSLIGTTSESDLDWVSDGLLRQMEVKMAERVY